MAKSKKRNTKGQRRSSNNENSGFQPLNMFFGGPRAAGYASIPNVS
jgi:hypothetical protein